MQSAIGGMRLVKELTCERTGPLLADHSCYYWMLVLFGDAAADATTSYDAHMCLLLVARKNVSVLLSSCVHSIKTLDLVVGNGYYYPNVFASPVSS